MTARLGLLLLLSLAAMAAQGAVRAWIDTGSMASDGTIELTLEHEGRTNDEPDLAPLKQDFDVLSSSRSSSLQVVNGSVTARVQIQLSLSPKHPGEIRIPAISWGGDHSDPLTVNVSSGSSGSAPAAGAASSGSKVFVETSVDTRQPYVQAAVRLTVRLYAAVPLYHATLDLPASNDVLVQQIGADHQEVQIRNGERYQVIERHYELFPQHSGELTLPGPVLDAQVAVQSRGSSDPFHDFFGNSQFGNMMPLNNFFTSTKPIRVRGDDIALHVLPRPAAAATGDYWLPARDLSLEAQWHPDQSEAKAGDPVTLDLRLKAQGLTAAQLPDLSTLLNLPSGLKAYPDQAKLDNDVHGDAVIGTREQSIALIADRSGHFTIPALTVHWWDTQSNQPREITLPARTLSIVPAETSPLAQSDAPIPVPAATRLASTPAERSPGATEDARWKWVSLGFCALWVLTLILWYLSYRRQGRSPPLRQTLESRAQPPLSISRARADFQSACRSNDARAARAGLMAWIAAAQPQARPVGLREFARHAGNPALSALLAELDRACYAGGDWRGSALLEALRDLPTPVAAVTKPGDELMPLYR
jgi:hypothetical protein